jgi:hypothetical protein
MGNRSYFRWMSSPHSRGGPVLILLPPRLGASAPHASLKQRKALNRGPYIKGDQDKPLLHGDVVHGLVR